ncbi:S8 family serine peptidase, partial [Rhizobiaceae sp. 2RAB30]
MHSIFRTIGFLAATTALVAPDLAFAGDKASPVPPSADAEYSRNWGVGMINALPAYLKGYTGRGIIVAVVDSGLDVDHPEFRDRIHWALRNFGSDKSINDVSPTVGEDGALDGHGTHVAGIIGAARDGSGMHGVAYESTILPFRAVGVEGFDPEADPTNEAIDYAVRAGAGVLNGSYGPGALLGQYLKDENGNYKLDDKGNAIENPNYRALDYQAIYDYPGSLAATYNTLKKAANADIVLVFAAGNDATEQT